MVKVEGSSYRQPGARMLVTDDGALTGAISGGCLEGDALKKAMLCITLKQNKLITYDTSNDDDAAFGVQLGCNGVVHILFEYIDASALNNPVFLLQQLENDRKGAVVLTLFSMDRNAGQPGTCLFYREGSDPLYANKHTEALYTEAKTTLLAKTSVIKELNFNGNNYHALIEFIPPPVRLVVAGAGNDVMPLAKAASLLGWELIIADGRATHAKVERFPEAKTILLVKPAELMKQLVLDANTYFVLMTHNYNYDLELLKQLLTTKITYIGILGPKTKLQRMLNDIEEQTGTMPGDAQLQCIYSPVGLDIGAETPEEIAISIIAEIKAVISNKPGASLKHKSEKIHGMMNNLKAGI